MLGLPDDGSPTDDFATISDVSVDAIASRVQPRQVATGVTRGTWRINNTDGSYITIGVIPNNGGFGFAFFDSSNNLVSKDTGVTEYVYDVSTGKNNMQLKKLPNGTYGFAVAASGYNVADGYS